MLLRLLFSFSSTKSYGLAVGERVRSDFPERELRQEFPSFDPGFTQGKGRILSNREASVPVLDQKGL